MEGCYKYIEGCLFQPIIWSMAAILRDSTVVVLRTHPRVIPLAMITMRKSTHGFPFVSYMSMGLHLAALCRSSAIKDNFDMGDNTIIGIKSSSQDDAALTVGILR